MTCHERLGHPRVGMMMKIIGNNTDHNLNTIKFPKSLEELIVRPSPLKIKVEPLKFLERIK
jgi:hypothetical protein